MEKKDLLSEIFSDKNERKMEKLYIQMKVFNMVLWKKILNFIKSAIPILFIYALLSWIYLSVYEMRGFETAVILALVGVMIRAGKSNK